MKKPDVFKMSDEKFIAYMANNEYYSQYNIYKRHIENLLPAGSRMCPNCEIVITKVQLEHIRINNCSCGLQFNNFIMKDKR
jgi:hypothetical protein